MEEEFNPYAAPHARALPEAANAHAVRQAHLRTESHLRAIGLFFTMGSIVAVLAQFLQARDFEREFGEAWVPWTAGISVVPFIAGLGLCCLRRWAWMLSVAFLGVSAVQNFSALSQNFVGLATLAVLLRFLLLAKTRCVMSENYPAIVAATPDLRSPVAGWGWWVFGFLALLGILASSVLLFT